MCGIVGYVGPKNSIPVLLDGLQKLEYRGYDSAGLALVSNTGFDVVRSVGKLSGLRNLLSEQGRLNPEGEASQKSKAAIGHTRWATHGRPSEQNAHPHVAGKICLVHNGIVENYAELKAELEKEGAQFTSETDSEVAAHYINRELGRCGDLLQAVKTSIKCFEGSYALVVTSTANPEQIVVAKNATPVVLGIGEGENFIASDIPAILEHTRKIHILEDGEIAVISDSSIRIELNGAVQEREPQHISWDPVTAEKGGYRHFMLKEIHEQPQVLTDTFGGRINLEHGKVYLDGFTLSPDQAQTLERIVIVACGTAWHAGLLAKFYIEQFARIPVDVDYGSEFRYRSSVINDKTLFLVISQSGETADSLGSLVLASQYTPHTAAICNVVGSSIARKAKHVVYTHAGPEISVASTKAFLTQAVVVYLLALHLGQLRGAIGVEKTRERMEDLIKLPNLVNTALKTNKQVERIARKYGKSNDFIFLGRGLLYPIALEGALKMKELSYIHAEGYPAGEMKHGPLALINEETPVVGVIGKDGVNYEKTMSNLVEAESRGGPVVAFTDIASSALRDVAWEVVELGEIPSNMLPIVLTVPLQLLAYHIAVYRGTDVDQPRNLAKSVTVE